MFHGIRGQSMDCPCIMMVIHLCQFYRSFNLLQTITKVGSLKEIQNAVGQEMADFCDLLENVRLQDCNLPTTTKILDNNQNFTSFLALLGSALDIDCFLLQQVGEMDE